ncbi:MAG TPA: stage III sporulation protein SpoIIIAB [Negativicutes bacterium]|nr:stage III sporulation protein SpoIIIAB [Negativicutes bacterium]
MWIKMLGATLVIAATSWAGFEAAQRFQQRPRQLRELQSCLQMLETEINYGLTPLPTALEKLAEGREGPIGDFCCAVKNELFAHQGMTMRAAWNISLDLLGKHCALTECDQNILRNFGATLGMSDRHDQIKHLKLAMSQLAAAETSAWEEKLKNERMFRALGILGGLAVVILFY